MELITRAEKIRTMDDSFLAAFLCYLTGSKCEKCFFGSNNDKECAAETYLKEYIKNDSEMFRITKYP